MPPPHPFFDPMRMTFEIIFTTIIVLLCGLIYFKTREIYALTKHKGIFYFRATFLFFALAYIFRLIWPIVTLSTMTFDVFIPRRVFMPIIAAATGYVSTMALFSLAYTTLWKKIGEKTFIITANIIAVAVSVISIIYRSPEILLYIQLGLVILILIATFKKKFTSTKLMYYLILALWLFSIFTIGIKIRMPFEIKTVLQVVSIGIFGIIYYKANKWLR